MKNRIDLSGYQTFSVSGEELCVLGGFFKIPVLYGVSGDFFSNWRTSPRKKVRDTVQWLEKKGMLYCGVDGIVRVKPDLYDVIECIGKAEWMLGMYARSKRELIKNSYIYGRKDQAAIINQKSEQRYELCRLSGMEDVKKILEPIQILRDVKSEEMLREKISCKDIKIIRDRINSFDWSGAKAFLQETLSEDNKNRVEEIWEILEGNILLYAWDFWECRSGGRRKLLGGYFAGKGSAVYRLHMAEGVLEVAQSTGTESIWNAVGKKIMGGNSQDGNDYCNGDG